MLHSNILDLPERIAAREADWRAGAVVYQVFVDRFAPSSDLDAKRALYPAPKTLRAWHETPAKGHFVESAGVWSHEIDFWGGDLASVRGKLDHLRAISADVLYLNPIHLAYTNHKYDSADYLEVSPEYGSRADLRMLVGDAHGRGLKVVLDGVFNHVGRRHRLFEEAMRDPNSKYRSWFFIGSEYPNGYRGWADVANLPDLHVEREEVREHLWNSPDSAVRSYLRDGVDGWRLDVASDLGPHFLRLDREVLLVALLTRKRRLQAVAPVYTGTVGGTPAYVLPNPSGLNAHTDVDDLAAHLRAAASGPP